MSEEDDSTDEQQEEEAGVVYKCAECGSEISEGSTYCSSCGDKLDSSVF